MIDTAEKLADLVPRVRQAEWLALDTEADSLHAYPEKLCLVQISLPGQDILLDPLVGLELSPLLRVLDGRELILHGADYDLRLLHRTYGFVPHRVFDTMLAARLVGVSKFSLKDLVVRYLGVKLEKGPQKADWARRPLTERMVTYARNDTRYLKPLADILRAELSRRRRLSWHEQMCAQLVRESVRTVVEDPDLIWRVKGANRLDRRSLAVLRELWFWREREALGASLPPFFILSHETLLDMAQASGQGRSVEALIPGRYSPRRRSALHKAIERAHHLPEAKLPALHRPHGQRLSPEGRRRAEQFRLRRDRQAAALGLEPALIASRAMLLTLARNWEKHSVELLPWQRELLQA